jgi:hypothetical protein
MAKPPGRHRLAMDRSLLGSLCKSEGTRGRVCGLLGHLGYELGAQWRELYRLASASVRVTTPPFGIRPDRHHWVSATAS